MPPAAERLTRPGPIVVFGAGGQVGRALLAGAARRGIAAVGIGRAAADITDAAAVAAALAAHGPRLVVNAAAYTAVDAAEREPAAAAAANVHGPQVLARAAATADVPILHLSTDYVFDGTKRGAYVEDDAVAPLGVYGRTKEAGERAVRAANARHVILRTSWVFGPEGRNFLTTMMRLARERDELRVVADQRGCPTATADLVDAMLAVDTALARDPACAGTYHFAGSGATSWHAFAEAIVAAQVPLTGKRPPVVAIASSDYSAPAARPNNSELASDRFAAMFGYRAQDWRIRTREIVAQVTRTLA